MTSYDIFHKIALNWMIPTYFFLGGLSCGLFFIAVVFNYRMKEYKPLAKPAAFLSPLFLAAGMGLLILDLGHPFRFWRLMVTFQPSSAASWGTWLLSIFFILNVAYAYLLNKGEDVKAKRVGYLGLPFAFLGATYTGILLAQMQGKAFWHSAILPWLFLIGAIISGLAFTILVGIAMGKTEELGTRFFSLGKILVWLVLLELGMIFTEVLVLLNGGIEAVVGAKTILVGNYSFLFWIVEVLLGAIIPLLILSGPNRKKLSFQSMAAVLILIGIFTMRYVVVMTGQV